MHTIDLDGPWRVREVGERKYLPATVPGCIHTDLIEAKKIKDPSWRDNLHNAQWVGESDWEYSRSFSVPEEFLSHDRALLRCEGLDTLATISINHKRLAKTDNMFRTWEFDVKGFLKSGSNLITVRFDSPLPLIAKKQKERFLNAWTHNGDAQYKIQGAAWIRKQQCQFGWDWAPFMISCGIWRSVRVIGFDMARISDVIITQDHSKKSGIRVGIKIKTEECGDSSLTASVTMTHKGSTVARERTSMKRGVGEVTLLIAAPKLWWPNGMGEQPLYEVAVDLMDAGGTHLDSSTRRIGLRTLDLVQKKDKWGESFYFQVNGIPFFAKGANLIPPDVFVSRLTREKYECLVKDSVSANFNMLRVWGGGIYEHEDFYDFCDEYGICVWQDFMFACSCYPVHDRAFMDNVKKEAEEIVRRLRHHACLALWCGNNEIEHGFLSSKATKMKMGWNEYKKLFYEFLPSTVMNSESNTAYISGSAHTPPPNQFDYFSLNAGDSHLWKLRDKREPFDEYYRSLIPRFCSEYGFQSLPVPKTCREHLAPGDMMVNSAVMETHSMASNKTEMLLDYFDQWFRMPCGFEQTTWLSQIMHSEALRIGAEHWRRNMPRTMGALHWYLTDNWFTINYGGIDLKGRWKAVHYVSRRFFAPLLVSGVEDIEKETCEIHVTSDLMKPCDGIVGWRLMSTNGKTIASDSRNIKIPFRKSRRIQTLYLKKFFLTHDKRDCILWLDLKVRNKTVATNSVLFSRPKQITIPDPEIAVEVKKNKGGSLEVRLVSKKPALWVWLDLSNSDVKFSDNFFHISSRRTVRIKAYPQERISLSEFRKQLIVRSLKDTYTS